MIYYVNAAAGRNGNGSLEKPFQTITEAAKIAAPGDEVIVAPGIYREYVDPVNAGTADQRIVYRSEEPLKAVITGAEQVKNWQPYEGTVWSARISNGVFGNYNPYTYIIKGDWYNSTDPVHTGEVYLNGKQLYEAFSLADVIAGEKKMASWDPEGTIYKWYTEQDGDYTVIYANFQGKNPNEENVEINVRHYCFYPSKEGVGYITLSGFTVKQAATTWAPPTAYQEGMVGPHWSKGWIIEDCEISDSRCSGISLGKYLQPSNDNKWTTHYLKDGTQTERENILLAQMEGWTKENIGSHIVRRCNIHDCGQTGIVGHLGCVFSLIEDNNIHHINNKLELAGAEIGGIKLHAAIDVIIRRNHFHHNTRGLWLDWQAQGTRVTQNLFDHNMAPEGTDINNRLALAEDLFIEVSHGPTLVDNNLLLSEASLKLATQGVALVHNIIAGSIISVGRGVENGGIRHATPRYTPYHVPHRTEVAGFMTILHGDVRFYNNIFVQQRIRKDLDDFAKNNLWDGMPLMTFDCGTKPYDGYPLPEDYFAQFCLRTTKDRTCRDLYYDHLPVYTSGNVYFNGAQPCDIEKNYKIVEEPVTIGVKCEDGKIFLDTNLYDYLPKFEIPVVDTELLGMAFEPEQFFENPDGTPIIFNKDYFGHDRGITPIAGPFACGKCAKGQLA